MSFQAEVLNVFIASPSDVSDQRDEIETAVYEWNSMYAQDLKVVLLPRRWEKDVAPAYGYGNPQGLINEQVVFHSDIVIGIFWHRIGFPTKNFPSGTLEEIDHFQKEGKDVLLYFVNQDKRYDNMDYEQAAAVQKYRKQYQSQGLYHEYVDKTQIKDDLYRTVKKFLGKKAEKDIQQIIDHTPDIVQETSSQYDEILGGKLNKLGTSSVVQYRGFTGVCEFDYLKNGGLYKIVTWAGSSDTQWSSADWNSGNRRSIRAYAINGICEVGIHAAKPQAFSGDIREDDFDFNFTVITLQENEVVLYRYKKTKEYLLVKVLEIENRTDGDRRDWVKIEYRHLDAHQMAT